MKISNVLTNDKNRPYVLSYIIWLRNSSIFVQGLLRNMILQQDCLKTNHHLSLNL